MVEEPIRRRLAAILAADVVGYTRLMEADEVGTLAALKIRRRDVLLPLVARHEGRVFKFTGDGVLVEFGSAVNAVQCALDLQQDMATANKGLAEDRQIVLRIGVNLGDILVEGSDLYGEGVNIAARLEAIAEPGGILISGTAYDHIRGKVKVGFDDLGTQSLRNIVEPVRAYRVAGTSTAVVAARKAATENPSIAVLPFTNMSGDPEQEYFVDGLVEDIITGLAHMPSLLVIARNSSFTYKGKAVDVRQVAKELGVRYVLEGSVRKTANRLRITGQLVDGASATHVWAEKFEGAFDDIFKLQDLLTESIIGRIEPSLRRAEIERARQKRPEHLDAYDLFLRALPHAYANTLADGELALRLLGECLRLDPNYAAAHAYLAWCHEQRFFRGGFRPDDKVAARDHSRTAMTIGSDDSQALSIGAFVNAMITHDYHGAIGALDRALELNENSALAFGFSAIVSSHCERYERAIAHAQKALRLSPFDPLNYHAYAALAVSYLLTDQYEQAVTYSTMAVQANPSFSVLHAYLVASQVSLGRLDAARAAAGRLKEIAPGFTISGFAGMGAFGQSSMERLADAWRQVGLPE